GKPAMGVGRVRRAFTCAGPYVAWPARRAQTAEQFTRGDSRMNLENFSPQHFSWTFAAGVGRVTLNRPERKNPLTFESYAELRDLFRALVYAKTVKAVVFGASGGNFCSGGDVHDIIAPLTKMSAPELLDFTRMTGDLVKAMRHCPQ